MNLLIQFDLCNTILSFSGSRLQDQKLYPAGLSQSKIRTSGLMIATQQMLLIAISLLFTNLIIIYPAWAVDQTQIGSGNSAAIQLAQKSPLIQSALSALNTQITQIQDRSIRSATLDAIANPKTCIQHRAGVTEAVKTKILQELTAARLVDPNDGRIFPGGLKAGIFPPVLNDGSRCPQLPQPFISAPGSAFGGHHSHPGGLVTHELFNDLNGLNLTDLYRRIYGQHDRSGLPIADLTKRNTADIIIRNDLMIAAPLWHDWAKTIVFQWNADGTEFAELSFGGNGSIDNNGQSGNSKTSGHHLIGLAEAMKRKLPPDFIITQASAHAAPTLGNEYKVVNWIRTAAILAQVDPIAAGYIIRDAQNQLRLPALYGLKDLNLPATGQTNLLAEYAIHNLSDADFVLSIPAVTISEEILRAIAPQFGYNPTAPTYNAQFRNPVLTYLSPERVFLIYTNQGLSGVRAEIQRLRQRKIT